MLSLCVFCGASRGSDSKWAEHARSAVRTIAESGVEVEIVYGGGSLGLMGIVANEAISLGLPVWGIIPSSLSEQREVLHPGLNHVQVTPDLLSRKQEMILRSHVFLALAGGLGTLDEVLEVLTHMQLNLIRGKEVWMDNTHGYWDHFFAMLDGFISKGFLAESFLGQIQKLDGTASMRSRLQERSRNL